MKKDTLHHKIELTETAIDLYLSDNYTLQNLAKETGMSASEIYALFPNKQAILSFYYPLLVIRYKAMIKEIDEFDSYTVSEKLSSFAFSLFDMMEERRAFVERTFDKYVWQSIGKNEFQDELSPLLKELIEQDPRISNSAGFFIGTLFYTAIRKQFLLLIRFWLNDDSTDQERTMALTDKITGLIEELLYSKVVDKGFDLLKYLINMTELKIKNLDLSDWFDEEDEDEESVNIEIEDVEIEQEDE